MDIKSFFDRLIYITTTLKSEDLHQYFYSIEFTSKDSPSNGLFFLAKSINDYNNVYHIEVSNDKIQGCYYVTMEVLDLEELIKYASKECGFSLLTHNNENDFIALVRGELKCFIHKNVTVNYTSYSIRLFKSVENETESVISVSLDKPR